MERSMEDDINSKNEATQNEITAVKKDLIDIEMRQRKEQGAKWTELEKEKISVMSKLEDLVNKLIFSDDELREIEKRTGSIYGYLRSSLSEAEKQKILKNRNFWIRANFKAK